MRIYLTSSDKANTTSQTLKKGKKTEYLHVPNSNRNRKLPYLFEELKIVLNCWYCFELDMLMP